jgi:hypothetical protein
MDHRLFNQTAPDEKVTQRRIRAVSHRRRKDEGARIERHTHGAHPAADLEQTGFSLVTDQLENFGDPEIIQIALQGDGHITGASN